jgi:3-dehydroquinate synthase
VDSSVGGKVAINTKAGKNLVGAFYQPRAVLMELQTLQTLSESELLSGYGEVIKYGLLGDSAFYAELLQLFSTPPLRGSQHTQYVGGGTRTHDADVTPPPSQGDGEHSESSHTHFYALFKHDAERLKYIIRHCCAMKAAIVEEDATEQGRRALLNLGHTFGHAIEKATNYTAPHGQTVAVGCLMAMRLSQLLGYTVEDAEIITLKQHFDYIGMPTRLHDFGDNYVWDAEQLTQYCYGDKKASDGALTFVVLERIGAAIVQKRVNPRLVQSVFAEYS